MDPSTMFDAAIKYAQTGERLRAAMGSLASPVAALTDLHELDEELEPELVAALEKLGEVMDALTRAFDFVTARFDVAQARARGDLPPPTEGEPT